MEIISQIFNCFHLFACFVLLLNHDTSPEFQKYLSATSSIPLRTMEATLYREEQGVKTEGLGCGRSVSRHSLTLGRTLEHTGLGQPVTQEGWFWRLIISSGDFTQQPLTITDDLFDWIQAHFIAKLISTMPQPPPQKKTDHQTWLRLTHSSASGSEMSQCSSDFQEKEEITARMLLSCLICTKPWVQLLVQHKSGPRGKRTRYTVQDQPQTSETTSLKK